MKAVTLLALRLCTGLYLVAWGAFKFASPERAVEISDKIYGGQFSNPVGQLALGAAAGVIGIFVILGFLRAFSYSAQAVILGFGAAAVGKAVFQPLIGNFDAVALIDAATVFLPSFTLFLLSLVPFVFWREDFVALDLDQIGDLEKRHGSPKAEPAIAAAPTVEALAEDVRSEPEAEPEPEVEAVEVAPVEEEAAVEAHAVEVVEHAAQDAEAHNAVHDVEAHAAEAVDAEFHGETAAEEIAAEEPAAEAAAPVEAHEPHGEEEPAEEAVHDDEGGEADPELVAHAAQVAEHHETRVAH
jgi:hypothetical protein